MCAPWYQFARRFSFVENAEIVVVFPVRFRSCGQEYRISPAENPEAGEPIHLWSREAAAHCLRPCLSDPQAMAVLRNLVHALDHDPSVSRQSDHEVLKRAAGLVLSGRLRLTRAARFGGVMHVGSPPGGPPRPARPRGLDRLTALGMPAGQAGRLLMDPAVQRLMSGQPSPGDALLRLASGAAVRVQPGSRAILLQPVNPSALPRWLRSVAARNPYGMLMQALLMVLTPGQTGGIRELTDADGRNWRLIGDQGRLLAFDHDPATGQLRLVAEFEVWGDRVYRNARVVGRLWPDGMIELFPGDPLPPPPPLVTPAPEPARPSIESFPADPPRPWIESYPADPPQVPTLEGFPAEAPDREMMILESRDSGTLRDDMIRNGHRFRPGEAAHHIVASNDRRAERSREILRGFGIDINGADNGVALPRPYHERLHTSRYHSDVENRLISAQSRDEALDALDALRQHLRGGSHQWGNR